MGDLKNRVRYPSTVDAEYLELLRKLSRDSDIDMSKLVDQALELLFDKYNVVYTKKKERNK